MSLSARDAHVFQLLIVFIIVTIAFYYLFLEGQYDVHSVYRGTVTGRKRLFIEDVLATEIDGPFDGSPLADLCNTKKWIPGLIFKCEPPQGGLANVRNIFLNCVRYAIEAGATGFIIPEIMVRRPKLDSLNELHAQRIVPFTYFFSQTHFKTTLGAACPQMHIYDHQNELWDVPSTASPVRLLHPHLATLSHMQAETVMLNPSNWTNAFNDHLNASHPVKFTEERPVLVSLYKPLLQWPIDYDQPAFIACFGRILKLNEDVRRLAAKVLYAMDEEFHLGLNPKIPGIQEGKFYGAHLRTAVDAAKAGWTPYQNQSENYLFHAATSRLGVIYAASDSAPDVLQFVDDAANYTIPMNVTTKDLLLAGPRYAKERAELAELTLDQQSLVDYEVLLRASRVGGTWESSFSWNLAMRRHVALGQGAWVPIESQELSVWFYSPNAASAFNATNARPNSGAAPAALSPPTTPTVPVASARISHVGPGMWKPTLGSKVDLIGLGEGARTGPNSEGGATQEGSQLTPWKGGTTPQSGALVPEKGESGEPSPEEAHPSPVEGDANAELEDEDGEEDDGAQEAGDAAPASKDQPQESDDQTQKADDKSQESDDKSLASDDKSEESSDKSQESDDKSQEAEGEAPQGKDEAPQTEDEKPQGEDDQTQESTDKSQEAGDEKPQAEDEAPMGDDEAPKGEDEKPQEPDKEPQAEDKPPQGQDDKPDDAPPENRDEPQESPSPPQEPDAPPATPPEKRAVPSTRQLDLPAELYPFSDAYTTVFGVLGPGDHPGVVFQLALWP